MNGDADVENKLVDTEGEEYGGQIEKLAFMYNIICEMNRQSRFDA